MYASRECHFHRNYMSNSPTFSSSTLTANIRRRRGSKVAINFPIYVDTNTPQPFIDPTIPYDRDVFPEDPGVLVHSYSYHFDSSPLFRGQKRRSFAEPHLLGCHGIRDGLFMSSDDVPSM